MMKKIIFAVIIVLFVGFCGYEIYKSNTQNNVEPLIGQVNDSVAESDSSNLMWIDTVIDENDSLLNKNETVVEENDTIVEISSAE